MRIFFFSLLLLTACFCKAAIRGDRPAPQLHSIFDGRAQPVAATLPFDEHLLAAQEAFFYDPHTAVVHRRTQPPGKGLSIAGCAFMGFGVGGYVATRLFVVEEQQPDRSGPGPAVLATFCLFGAALGLLLFLIGTIIAGAHGKPYVPEKEAVF